MDKENKEEQQKFISINILGTSVEDEEKGGPQWTKYLQGRRGQNLNEIIVFSLED